MAADPGRYFYADQYRNPANPLAHYRTTGPEIWDQTLGRVTHFVAGLGTCGTVVGTGRYLRERRPDVHVVAVEPDHGMHGMEGLKHLATSIVPEVYDRKAHDEKVTVSTEDAYVACAEVLASDGLLVGHSAGAALVAARRLAARVGEGVIVAAAARRRRALSGGGVKIRAEQVQAIEDHARRGYPFEVCGVLVGRRAAEVVVESVIPVDEPRARSAARPLPDRARGPPAHPEGEPRRAPRHRRLLPQPSRPPARGLPRPTAGSPPRGSRTAWCTWWSP